MKYLKKKFKINLEISASYSFKKIYRKKTIYYETPRAALANRPTTRPQGLTVDVTRLRSKLPNKVVVLRQNVELPAKLSMTVLCLYIGKKKMSQ